MAQGRALGWCTGGCCTQARFASGGCPPLRSPTPPLSVQGVLKPKGFLRKTGKAVAKQVGQDLMNAEAKEEGKVAEPLSVGGSPDPASDPDLRSGRMPDPVSSPPPKACPQP